MDNKTKNSQPQTKVLKKKKVYYCNIYQLNLSKDYGTPC